MRADDHLPHDLEPTAEQLRQARHSASALELDALHQRAFAARPAKGLRRSGRGLAGSLLAAAALLTGGATIVVAAGSVSGSSSGWTPVEEDGQAAACQYSDSYSQSYTGTSSKGNSNATLSASYTCSSRTMCISSDKAISNYSFNGGATTNTKGPEVYEVCAEVPEGADAIYATVKSGTTAYTFKFALPAA